MVTIMPQQQQSGFNTFGNILGSVGEALMLSDPRYADAALEMRRQRAAKEQQERELEMQRQLLPLKRQNIESQIAERQASIGEARRRREIAGKLRSALQNPEVLGRLSEQFGLPQELLANVGSVDDIAELGRLTQPQGGTVEANVKQIMADNPGMNYTQALQLYQTGFRQNTMVDPETGQVVPMQGAPSALGSLARGEKYGGKLGELEARQELEPGVTEAVEEARVKGAGEITPVEKRELELKEAERLGKTSLISEVDNLQNINKVIDNIAENADAWTTGFMGKVGSFVPGSPQSDLAANLETVLADSALNKLVELKNSSATGASGLGQVTEREISMLQASRAALLQSQSPEQFKENLARYKEQRNKTVQRVAEAFQERFGEVPEEVKSLIKGSAEERGGSKTYTADNPAQPKTMEEYNALPKGAYFIDDEGLKVK